MVSGVHYNKPGTYTVFNAEWIIVPRNIPNIFHRGPGSDDFDVREREPVEITVTQGHENDHTPTSALDAATT